VDDDGQTGQGTGAGTQSGTDGGTGTTDTTGQQTAQSGGQANDGNPTVSRADFEQIKNQLRAADQRRDAAEKKAQALEDAKLSESERTTKALKDTQAENTALQAQVKDLRIQNAFLTDNSHEWHDPKAALKLADMASVEIDDEGNVKGLKEVLEALAKSSPFLLKPKADGEDDGKKPAEPGPVLTGVGGGGTGQTGSDKNSIMKRFPQLAGRVS
jgi:hypothetical protein